MGGLESARRETATSVLTIRKQVFVAYRAHAKLDLGAYEEALDFYRQAKDLDPNYATGRFNMAAALVELRQLE